MIAVISLTLLCIFCNLDVAVAGIKETLIQDGDPIDITKVPYQLSLEAIEDGKPYEHVCGAVIIGDQWALTAAHCVVGKKNLRVRAGASNRINGEIIYVKNVFINQGFNLATGDYDIAVLKMQTAFKFSASVKPIPLATAVPPAGTRAITAGWGITTIGGKLVFTLRGVELTVLPFKACTEAYAALGRTITDRMLCAGLITEEKKPCRGDSGGPLASGGKLIGITSWGYGCTLTKGPTVYANVVKLSSWIKNVQQHN